MFRILKQRRRRTGLWLFHDTFSRANGALGVSESGHLWTNHTGNGQVSGGTFLHDATAESASTVDVGVSDFEDLGADILAAVAQTHVLFRFVNATNYLIAGYQSATTDLTLWRNVAGVFTQLGIFAAGARLRPRVRARGTTLEVYLAGALRIGPITEAAHVSATRVGIFGGSAQADNIALGV